MLELESLTRSIREFGVVDPIIARRPDGFVIGTAGPSVVCPLIGDKHGPHKQR